MLAAALQLPAGIFDLAHHLIETVLGIENPKCETPPPATGSFVLTWHRVIVSFTPGE
jgi:hypothetical protein